MKFRVRGAVRAKNLWPAVKMMSHADVGNTASVDHMDMAEQM